MEVREQLLGVALSLSMGSGMKPKLLGLDSK